jgi:superfamily II DNA or RNA helicase
MQIKTGFTTSYSSKNWVQIDSNLLVNKKSYSKPRTWQTECYNTLIDHKGISIINAPTGSGKSTMISLLGSAKLLKDNNLKLIIAVPQTIIGKGFTKKNILLPGDIPVDWDPGIQLCDKSNKNIESITSWIKTPVFKPDERFQERILVCTYSTLTSAFSRMTSEERNQYWKDILVVVDEAHHVSIQETEDELTISNKLGDIIKYIYNTKDSNNEAILITATFFRGDSKSLLSNEIQESSKRYNLPFDVYISQMNYFKSFSYDFVIDAVDYTKNIKECVDNLDATNHKKLVIYIPTRNTAFAYDKDAEVTEILQGLMDSKGATNKFIDKNGLIHLTNNEGLDYKVLDLVTEQNQSKSKKFFQKPVINQNSDSLDCIITLNMFKEGADWEYADGMIITGKRNSLTDVIQMVGRLLRDKPGKSTVRVLHMLEYSIGNELNDDLEDNLNDYFKAIAISLLMEEVFQPIKIAVNKETKSGKSSSENDNSSSIYNELGLDENQISNLIESSIKDLINFSQGIRETKDTCSNADLKNKMPEFVESWLQLNNLEFTDEQCTQLSNKIFASLCNRDVKTNNLGINLSEIDWEMLESSDPINCILRYTGYPINEEGLKQLRAILSNLENASNEMCHKVCQWIKNNNKVPIQNSKDPLENNYAEWISRQKRGKSGKGIIFYQTNQNIAESYNFFDLFEYIDLEKLSNDMCHLVCQWIKENKKDPSQKSKDLNEKKMGRWLSSQKMYKKGKFNGKFYDTNQKIADAHQLFDLFEIEDSENATNEMCHIVCQWIKNNNKVPVSRSNDDNEKKYYSWINRQRRAKQNKLFYQSNQDIVESYGYEDLFKIESLEEKSNIKTHELCKWIVENNKIPIGKSDDTIESKLNEFLSSRKKAYSKTSKGAWFDSDLDIVKSYGLGNIFEIRDSETNANDKVIEICKWICDNNKMPSRMSKDENEVLLSKTLVRFRQIRKAKKHQWFDSNDKIALSYGLPGLFEVTKNMNNSETE